MERITVLKSELLAKLEQNRTDHRRIFEEALEGFRREAEADLDARLAEIREGKRRDVVIRKMVPRDHTADYDRAISMVRMAVSDTMILTETDFAQYVMDDWGWQREFVRNSYGSASASGKFSDYMDG